MFNQVTSSCFRSSNNKWSSSIHFFILPFTKVEIFYYMYLPLNYLFSNQKLFIPHKLYCRNNGLGKHRQHFKNITLKKGKRLFSWDKSFQKKVTKNFFSSCNFYKGLQKHQKQQPTIENGFWCFFDPSWAFEIKKHQKTSAQKQQVKAKFIDMSNDVFYIWCDSCDNVPLSIRNLTWHLSCSKMGGFKELDVFSLSRNISFIFHH